MPVLEHQPSLQNFDPMLRSLPFAVIVLTVAAVKTQAMSNMASGLQPCQLAGDACFTPYTTASMPPCWTNSTQLITATTTVTSTITIKTLTLTTSALVHSSAHINGSIHASNSFHPSMPPSNPYTSIDAPNLTSPASIASPTPLSITTPLQTGSTSSLSSLRSPTRPVSNSTITTPPYQSQTSTNSTKPLTSLVVVPLTVSDPHLVSTLPTTYESMSFTTDTGVSTRHAVPTPFSTIKRAASTTAVPVVESVNEACRVLESPKLGLVGRASVAWLLLLAILGGV